MRLNLGKKSALYPMVVLIIATYNDDGSVNAMNAAWGGISDTNEIGICLAMHKSTKNILKRKAFTVSMATAEMIEACDYVGLVIGHEEPEKFSVPGLPLLAVNMSMRRFSMNFR